MLLHFALFQPQAQVADDFAGVFVFAYNVIKNLAQIGEVGVAACEDALRSLRITQDGAQRLGNSCAIEPESSPNIVTRERCAISLR